MITNHEARLNVLASELKNRTAGTLTREDINHIVKSAGSHVKYHVEVINKEELLKLLLTPAMDRSKSRLTAIDNTSINPIMGITIERESEELKPKFNHGDVCVLHKRAFVTLPERVNRDIKHTLLVYVHQLEDKLREGMVRKSDIKSHFRI